MRRRDEAATAAGATSAGGRGRRERSLASVVGRVVDDVVELLGGLAQLDLVELAPHPLPPRRNAWKERRGVRLFHFMSVTPFGTFKQIVDEA